MEAPSPPPHLAFIKPNGRKVMTDFLHIRDNMVTMDDSKSTVHRRDPSTPRRPICALSYETTSARVDYLIKGKSFPSATQFSSRPTVPKSWIDTNLNPLPPFTVTRGPRSVPHQPVHQDLTPWRVIGLLTDKVTER